MQDCFQIEEEMALRNEDKDWIQSEIQAAIAVLEPHGWRKVTHFLKEWGLVATVFAVPLTLLGLLITVVIFAANGITKNAEFRTHTEDRLTGIEGNLARINATLEGQKLKQIGSNPTNPENIAEAKNVLIAAASSKTKIDRSIVQDVGGQFVQAAQKDPAAWSTVLAFLNYKSFLDSFAPKIPVGTPGKFDTHYNTADIPAGDSVPHFMVGGGLVPISEAVQFNRIGKDLNQAQGKGNAFMIVEGGGQVIDGWQLKNVVFHNVHIVYKGGALRMENVYFVNCRFDVELQPNGEQFANKFLQSDPAASFTTG